MLFSSTIVSSGTAVGVVAYTGMKTAIGSVHSEVQAAEKEESKTPLEEKVDNFGDTLAKVIFAICAIVWIINYKHFFDPVHGSFLRGCIYYFKIAVALAVAAIPEGLPAVITTCLALGTKKMAKPNAIVRKLPSVETLGCTTAICSDKTGTLTTNEMCAVRLMLPESPGKTVMHVVDGHTYAPVGKVRDLDSQWYDKNKALASFCRTGALCNESRLFVNDEGGFARAGEPTEAAIRVLVEKLGCPDAAVNQRALQKPRRSKEDAMAFSDHWAAGGQKMATLEFTRDRKSMSVIYSDAATGRNTLYAKGAPEGILERCTGQPQTSTQR